MRCLALFATVYDVGRQKLCITLNPPFHMLSEHVRPCGKLQNPVVVLECCFLCAELSCARTRALLVRCVTGGCNLRAAKCYRLDPPHAHDLGSCTVSRVSEQDSCQR